MFSANKISCPKLRFKSFISTSPVLECGNRKKPPIVKKNVKNDSVRNENVDKMLYKKVLSEEEKLKAKKHLELLLKEMSCTFLAENVSKELTKEKITILTPKRRPPKQIVNPLHEKHLKKAALEAASDLGGDVQKTEQELYNSIKNIVAEPQGSDQKLFAAPVVQKAITKNKNFNAIPQKKFKEVSEKMQNTLKEISIVESDERNFSFDCHPVGIFDPNIDWGEQLKMKIWDDLEEGKLSYLKSIPPKNYYEEMILWTNQGKLWHFPIDNDQGRSDEAEVNFSEHVFLEEYLQDWCPKRGPLRHFMELVLVGLSKNPYLSVEDKKEHIFWFRDYFEDKRKLLQELGAFSPAKQISDST